MKFDGIMLSADVIHIIIDEEAEKIRMLVDYRQAATRLRCGGDQAPQWQ